MLRRAIDFRGLDSEGAALFMFRVTAIVYFFGVAIAFGGPSDALWNGLDHPAVGFPKTVYPDRVYP
jgi:hypothetical protein